MNNELRSVLFYIKIQAELHTEPLCNWDDFRRKADIRGWNGAGIACKNYKQRYLSADYVLCCITSVQSARIRWFADANEETIKSITHVPGDDFNSKLILSCESTSVKLLRWPKWTSYRKFAASCSFSRPNLGVYPPWPWVFREPGRRSITLQTDRTWSVLNCSHLRINVVMTLARLISLYEEWIWRCLWQSISIEHLRRVFWENI